MFLTFFLFILTLILLVLRFQVVQKQSLDEVKKLKGHSMFSCVRNVIFKNY